MAAVLMISLYTLQKMNKKYQNCVKTKLIINGMNSFENQVEPAEFTNKKKNNNR